MAERHITVKIKERCTGCGRKFDYGDTANVVEPTAELAFNFGYWSRMDGDFGNFDFCQTCSIKLLDLTKKEFPDIKLESQWFEDLPEKERK